MLEVNKKMLETACECMKALGISKGVRDAFEKDETVYFSECAPETGIRKGTMTPLDDNLQYLVWVRKIEAENSIKVYHCCHYKASYGDILDCLYLPEFDADEDEPESEYLESLREYSETTKDRIAFIYAINFTTEIYSEFGSGRYKSSLGGLVKEA